MSQADRDYDATVRDIMLTHGAYWEFELLNGRAPTSDELAEFKPKFDAAVKAGAFRLRDEDDEQCPVCAARGERGNVLREGDGVFVHNGNHVVVHKNLPSTSWWTIDCLGPCCWPVVKHWPGRGGDVAS